MTRNLLRLAVLVFALSATFGLTLPRPALAVTCGSGNFFTSCTKKCCGPGVTTTFNRTGLGSSCGAARSACSSCLPACPSGQSLCGGPTFGACGTLAAPR
ncbi:MAG: hypothetical protein JF614_07970 [Acidobacteria bacterium]|nr:hypothetical protein [Acidobacteriota bacterium]